MLGRRLPPILGALYMGWLGWILLLPNLAAATPQVGLEVGIGRLDDRLRVHVRPDFRLLAEHHLLHLAAPIEFFPSDVSLRTQDWDSLTDYTALLQALNWQWGALKVRGGKLHLSTASETVVQRYPIGHHPNRPGSAISIRFQSHRWRSHLGLAHHFALASLGYSLWRPKSQQPVQPELALSLAVTDDSPITMGTDGRIALDLTLPYHGNGFAIAGYASAVAGIGSDQDGEWRVHGGLRGEHRLDPHWLRWRLELRHSPTGLVAQPFDSIFGMLEPKSRAVITPNSGLGFAAQLQWSDRLRIRFAQDPGLQRAEALATIHRGKIVRLYFGTGWMGEMEHPFLLSECRWSIQKGATLFARARFLERSIDGVVVRGVLDGMIGVSWALALQPGK